MDRTEVEELVVVASKSVSCGGGGGSSGHPNVYLKLGDTKKVVCPYCSRLFVLNMGDADEAGLGVEN